MSATLWHSLSHIVPPSQTIKGQSLSPLFSQYLAGFNLSLLQLNPSIPLRVIQVGNSAAPRTKNGCLIFELIIIRESERRRRGLGSQKSGIFFCSFKTPESSDMVWSSGMVTGFDTVLAAAVVLLSGHALVVRHGLWL